jgi:electron-transferring-flavoprotein dehydrogenase
MGNHGNYVASLGKVVRWLADIAEKKGIQVFPGFSGHELIYENDAVAGVQTGDSGIDKHGNKKENYQPGTEVRSKITILAEGARGHLTKKLIEKFDLAKASNHQVYSTAVKELWEIPEGTFQPGRAMHAMGYPLTFEQFGGSFIYGLSKTQVVVGLVVGLDYKDPTFDPHHAFQIFKKHPFVSKILEKGRMVRYGAKVIPEGGLFSMPEMYHDGVMIVGDSAGFLSMPSLKGIHLGIESGMMAAKSAFEALKKNDFSKNQLALYAELFKKSNARKDLYRVRNFRQGFKKNLFFISERKL